MSSAESKSSDDFDRSVPPSFDESDDNVQGSSESKLAVSEGSSTLPSESVDPKVMEFLRILDEYRIKCEDEGNYAEAERASTQLDSLRNQEIKRSLKAVKARQLSERQEIQVAHNLQFQQFNDAWDKYLAEYDTMSQEYITQMTQRHAQELREHQEAMHTKLSKKPAKFSKELLEWRRRQHMLAKAGNYAEAQRVKKIADDLESKERSKMDTAFDSAFEAHEAKFRAKQQAELNALLKRIDVRRKEHLSQRNQDSKRLLQRNRNVQSVLVQKQSVEERIARNEIKTRLARPRNGVFGQIPTGPASGIQSPKRALLTNGPSKSMEGRASPSPSGTFITDEEKF